MCGIAGIIGRSDKAALSKMLNTLKHRGPDGEGVFDIPGKLSIGMVRLSIIDIETGHQPIGNEDGTLQIVYNGEIYNYIELREELKNKGHVFKTYSDTEVVVHLYEELGEDCVTRLNGMFAFALWDNRENRVLLARDRLGIKPLYYISHDRAVYFASEINALVALPQLKKGINLNSVYNYFGGMVCTGEETAFKDIYRFPPGHTASVKDNSIIKKKYWNLKFTPKNNKSDGELCEEFNALFDDSVKLQLRSDVPLGVFLSGGIDSSAVAQRAAASLGRIKTFSLGFCEKDYGEVDDELAFARETANFLGSEHYEFRLEGDEVYEHLKDTVISFGDLYSGPTPQYFLARLASKYIKVALTGLGGDELFGSYGRPARFVRDIGWKTSLMWPVVNSSNAARNIFGKIEAFVPLPARNVLKRLFESGSVYSNRAEAIFKGMRREAIFREEVFESLDKNKLCEKYYQDIFDGLFAEQIEDVIMGVDLKTQLVDEYLAYVDRFTMAHSLEARVPFLDHRLVEWAAALPVDKRCRPGDDKYLLKKALKKYLPKNIFTRKKMGFSVPYGKWLEGPLSRLIDEYLSPELVTKHGIFDAMSIKKIVDEFRGGRRGAVVYQLWSLVMFQQWHFIFFK